MPIVRLGSEGRWTNYHGTGTCEAATRFALRSGDAERGRDEIAIAAGSVQDWLVDAIAAQRRVRPLGAGWSPSNINIASQSWLLHTRRFNRCFGIDAADTTFIDDNPANVEAAKQMGMQGIVFCGADKLREQLR